MAQSSSSYSSNSGAPGSSKDNFGNNKRGVGYGTRFSVAENDLPPGWRCERSSKYTVWFDDQGK